MFFYFITILGEVWQLQIQFFVHTHANHIPLTILWFCGILVVVPDGGVQFLCTYKFWCVTRQLILHNFKVEKVFNHFNPDLKTEEKLATLGTTR